MEGQLLYVHTEAGLFSFKYEYLSLSEPSALEFAPSKFQIQKTEESS